MNIALGNTVPPPSNDTDWSEGSAFEKVKELLQQDPPKLLDRSIHKEEYSTNDFIRNATDYNWFRTDTFFAFPGGLEADFGPKRVAKVIADFDNNLNLTKAAQPQHQELINHLLYNATEDALAAFFLAFPFLNQPGTLIHDIGCWNGHFLQSLQVYALLRGAPLPTGIGTDINISSLNMAKALAKVTGISPQSHYYMAHALNPIDISSLGLVHGKVVKTALRLIAILDHPSAREFLTVIRKSLQENAIAIVSYPCQKEETMRYL